MALDQEHVTRAEYMAHWYNQGSTLQEVGDAFEISGERVRQVLRQTGVPPRKIEPADPVRLMAECRRANGLTEATRAAGCDYNAAKECLEALGVLPALERLWRWRQGKTRKLWTRTALIRRMQEVAEIVGHAPTKVELDKHKPNSQTYQYHFGSLAAAQEAAGFTPRALGERVDPIAWREKIIASHARRR